MQIGDGKPAGFFGGVNPAGELTETGTAGPRIPPPLTHGVGMRRAEATGPPPAGVFWGGYRPSGLQPPTTPPKAERQFNSRSR